MQVGSLVKLLGSPWLGMGIVLDYSSNSATVFFPNASIDHYPYDKTVQIWRERLEVINESR
ncbi:MAG: hypothetical protein GOVbin1807_232 [Prokaryotic dsDNA virus sp.]|nr:MAG: hypothetical protein GOVbin1807_232 [Prokaryotic dsDNA virus sp.]